MQYVTEADPDNTNGVVEIMTESDSDLQLKYEWQKMVVDTLMELRPKRSLAKVKATNRAIYNRLFDSTIDVAERMALHDTLGLLQVLFPSINQTPTKVQTQKSALEVRRLRIKTRHRTRKSIQALIGNKSVQSS